MKKCSVYQRNSDGRWVGYVVTGEPENGKRAPRKYVYGKNEKETWDKVHELMYKLQTGEYIAPSKDSLIEFLKEYHRVCAGYDMWNPKSKRPDKAKWEETTAELYKMYIDVHFSPYFKNMKLKDVKAITLDEFYNYKMTTEREYEVKQGQTVVKKKMPPLSSNTVIKLHKFLKAAFRYAVINDKIKKNPADGVKTLSFEKYKPTVYNEEQFIKLLKAVHGKDEEIPIILGAGCGLRRGEILGLKWENVDFSNKTISIEVTRVNFTSNRTKKPKTETSARKIIAPDYVMDILSTYYELKGNPDKETNIVTRWKPKSLSERFKILLDQYGLTHIRLHDLRHYNAVIMLKSGIPDKVAAERLGHANVSTLREVYQHVIKDMDEAAADKINNAIRPKEDRSLSKEEKKAKFKIV